MFGVIPKALPVCQVGWTSSHKKLKKTQTYLHTKTSARRSKAAEDMPHVHPLFFLCLTVSASMQFTQCKSSNGGLRRSPHLMLADVWRLQPQPGLLCVLLRSQSRLWVKRKLLSVLVTDIACRAV